jgi:hypothetical protein
MAALQYKRGADRQAREIVVLVEGKRKRRVAVAEREFAVGARRGVDGESH